MDTLYSCSLLIALIAGCAGILLGIFALARSSSRLLFRAGCSAIGLGALGLATSAATHRHWGHGPTSVEPMDIARFIASHPAFLVAGAIILVGLMVLLYARRRRRLTA